MSKIKELWFSISPNNRDLIVRVSKTFIQAFLGAWAATGFSFNGAAFGGAVGAAAALVMNVPYAKKDR